MRLFTSVLASVAMLFAASSASAVTFLANATVDSGRALDALQVGDIVTIDIRMSNPAAVAIFGIGGGVQGWDNGVAQFQSAELGIGKYFCTGTNPATCPAGLDNGLSFATDENTGNYLVGPADVQVIGGGTGNYFPIVQSISTTGRNGNGAKDPGLNGVINGGDAQFRIVFRAAAPGTTTIDIGTNPNPILGNVVALTGGNSELAINALVALTVLPVPEPGTALLMGLGLAGLAAAGRRQ